MQQIQRRRLSILQLDRRDVPSISAVGSQFIVNTHTVDNQQFPAIAMDFNGDFIAAWESNGQDGDGFGVYAKRYASGGTFEFRVNSFTMGDQRIPAIAMDAAGDTVIVWISQAQDGSDWGVYGQRFDAVGNRSGPEFRVNSFTTGDQSHPTVAMDSLGDFVVGWDSYAQDGDSFGVYAQAYNAIGTPQGGEFRVNSFTTGSQVLPRLAMDEVGDFVVTWESFGQDGSDFGVYAQRFNSARIAQGGEFRVNTFTTGFQSKPSVAMDGAGDFAIGWQSYEQEGTGLGYGIYSQRFSAPGAPLGPETHINSGVLGDQQNPRVAASANTGFVIAFDSGPPTSAGISHDVFARTISAAGVLGPSQFPVNSYTTGVQFASDVAMDASGDIVVAWVGEGNDNFGVVDISGVFAQRYVESADTAGPLITGVYTPQSTQPVSQGQRLIAPVASLTVAFAEDMNQSGGSLGANSVTNPANWGLALSGNSISNQISGITYGFNVNTGRFEATLSLSAPLTDGLYALTPGANLRDVVGNLLDGNYDGTPGGAYSRTFRIAVPVPVGLETQVNTTLGPTFITTPRTATAADAAGDYVVAYRGSSSAFFTGVFAQTYTAGGLPRGPEIQVSPDGGGKIGVAMDPAGNFVVTYYGGATGFIYARRFTVNGAPLGSEFQVNLTSSGFHDNASVAVDGAGNMIFAWEFRISVTGNATTFARRFNSAGMPISPDFLVYAASTADQRVPVVAADAVGNFVVAWQGAQEGLNGFGIYAQRFTVEGALLGTEIHVNTFDLGDQTNPSVAMDAAGNFVVAWNSTNQEGASSGLGVIAQRFDTAGNYSGDTIVNTFTTGNQQNPSVSMDHAGDFVVAWESYGQDASSWGIDAQRFSPTLTQQGNEIHVNTFTTGDQRFPAAAMDGDGDFVVGWQSFQGGANSQIVMQRFGVAPPRLTAVAVNGQAVQRSRVTIIGVAFSSLVSFTGNPAAAFTLTRNSDNMPVTFSATVGINNNATVVSLANFAGSATDFGSLADGRYTLTAFASQISNLGGALDGNGNQIGGDDFQLVGTPANGLFRLFGDSDGNGVVNSADFLAFRSAFGGNTAAFDFNNNGSVDASDFLAFRSRFGSSV